MGVSKVILDGTTLMDVTNDTVAANNLLNGNTALGANGVRVQGAVTVPVLQNSKSVTVTQNGTQTVTPDTGNDGMSVVEITTNVPQTTVSALSVTSNGTYTAPSGTAYSPVTVAIPGALGVSF